MVDTSRHLGFSTEKTQEGWKKASNISDPGINLVVYCLLSSLDSNKEYEFGIISFNKLGESEGIVQGN